MRKRRGFTLIELLVVVAIIAILASILFSIFLKVKEQGRRATCVSRLKQWGVAFQTYANDYNGFAPHSSLAWLGVRYGGMQQGDLVDPMWSYVNRNWKMWFCPSDPTAKLRTGPVNGIGIKDHWSYGYNWWKAGNQDFIDNRLKNKIKYDEIPTKPTPGKPPRDKWGKYLAPDWSTWQAVYILDEFNGPDPGKDWTGKVAGDEDGDAIPDCYQRHARGANLLLSDGRVQFVHDYDFTNQSGW